MIVLNKQCWLVNFIKFLNGHIKKYFLNNFYLGDGQACSWFMHPCDGSLGAVPAVPAVPPPRPAASPMLPTRFSLKNELNTSGCRLTCEKRGRHDCLPIQGGVCITPFHHHIQNKTLSWGPECLSCFQHLCLAGLSRWFSLLMACMPCTYQLSITCLKRLVIVCLCVFQQMKKCLKPKSMTSCLT